VGESKREVRGGRQEKKKMQEMPIEDRKEERRWKNEAEPLGT